MVLVAVIIGVRGLQFGIEFVGGTSVTFHGTGDTTIEQVRDAFDDAGVSDPVLQTTNADGDTGILARMTTTSAETRRISRIRWPTSSAGAPTASR